MSTQAKRAGRKPEARSEAEPSGVDTGVEARSEAEPSGVEPGRSRAKSTRRALALALSVGLTGDAASAEPLSREAQDYALQCQGCHGPDGAGIVGSVPTLHGVGRLAATPAGRAYLAQVPGVANASLSDARLAALLGFVLARWSARELPAHFVPYTAAEVARLRAQPLLDAPAARRRLGP